MSYQSFEDLDVWKRSCQLATEIIEHIQNSKLFPLRDQMIRSAISIPSNIAEGQERDYPQDFIRFLRIAKGSCGELRTQLYLSSKLSVIPQDVCSAFINETKEISRMLQGLIRSLQPS